MKLRSKRFDWLILVVLCCFTGCSTQSVEKQVLRAIETDSSISNSDLQIIDPTKTLKLEDCKGKPLTIAVLTMPAPINQSNTPTPSLQFFPSSNPTKLFEEIQRTGRPLTLFHADRITKLECVVDGGEATGTFSVLVPDLFQGKVGYVAKKYFGRWIIDDFLLPSFDTRFVRQSDGTWQAFSLANRLPYQESFPLPSTHSGRTLPSASSSQIRSCKLTHGQI